MSGIVDDDRGMEVQESNEPVESGRPDKPFTALSEIRQLVEGFYDIQHLRMETYNRIVAYVKQNAADIIVFLQKASQFKLENHSLNASQDSPENHECSASHPSIETHAIEASHEKLEAQRTNASHPKLENQNSDASHSDVETQIENVSQSFTETQIVRAIRFLEGKEYSKFVDMMLAATASDEPSGKSRRGRKPKSQKLNENHIQNASHLSIGNQKIKASHLKGENHILPASQPTIENHMEYASHAGNGNHIASASHKNGENHSVPVSQPAIETHNPIVSQSIDETHPDSASHTTNATHYLIASESANLPFSELLRPIVNEIDNLVWFYNNMHGVEVGLGKRLERWSTSHPLRVNFLSRVYGIGGIFSSGIIAWLDEPILKSEYVSSIWRYCGLAPTSKRVAGHKTDYDVKLKSFCWKISTSFIKFHCFGRQLYLQFKEDVKRKHPEPVQAVDLNGKPIFYKSGDPKMLWTPKHIDLYARRKVVKLFLSSVWETWRKMNNLPVGNLYPMEHLGHKHYIAPERWMEKRPKGEAG